LTLPFAVLTAVIAAVLETSVFAELPVAGATIDVVLVCAAVATIVLGVEDGLVLAFVGGLIIDMVVAARPMGAATLALLLTLGIAFVIARSIGAGRRTVAIGLVLILTAIYHALFIVIIGVTANASFSFDEQTIAAILVAAVLNAVLAFPVAALFGVIERRFGPSERQDWVSAR
jgi:rod shape-determining protein MreD